MKKLKKLLPAIVSVVMALTLVFAAACSNGCNREPDNPNPTPPDVTRTLSDITLDYSGAKTTFDYGEEFSAQGLTVTAVYSKSDGTTENVPVALTDSNLVIDSSAYKSEVAGTYTISVTYSDGEVFKTKPYSVTVSEPQSVRDGVNVALTSGVLSGMTISNDKFMGEIVLSSELKTVTLDPSKIEVRRPNAQGEVDLSSAAVAASEYTVKVYKDKTEVTDFTNLGAGVYQIWATLTQKVENHTLEGFAVIYVIDNLESLALDDGATLTQQTGALDTMSPTWNFTATYSTGATVKLTADDVKFAPEIATNVAGEFSTTATYTEANQKGEQKSASCQIDYEITQASGRQTYKYDYDYNLLDEALGVENNKKVLTKDDMTGANAFLTPLEGAVTFRSEMKDGKKSNNFIEIKNDALTVTFVGTGTITIGVSSTGSSNKSAFGLKDSTGKFLVPTTVPEGATLVEAGDATAAEGTYKISGTGEVKFTFAISAPGTYTLHSYYSENDSSRGCRVKSVHMEDVVESAPSQTEHKYEYSYDLLDEALGVENNRKVLTKDDMTGANAFLTPLEGAVTFRSEMKDGKKSNNFIEIKNDALTVTFVGTGTITIGVSSTGSSNKSAFGLKDSTGKFLVPTTVPEGATLVEAGDATAAEGTYKISGTGEVTFTFTIATPGVYTLHSLYTESGSSRGCRVKGVTMSDWY